MGLGASSSSAEIVEAADATEATDAAVAAAAAATGSGIRASLATLELEVGSEATFCDETVRQAVVQNRCKLSSPINLR